MRLSEIYESIQGEGPRVGTPTIFVRFAGCNLRCPGWPCDTQHAIDPAKFRHEWQSVEPDELYTRIKAAPHYNTIRNICFTGGEPFLQPKNELEDLYMTLSADDKRVECFSNGKFDYPDWARSINFVMDWKLTGSGEKSQGLIIDTPEWRNFERLYDWEGLAEHAVKFTVTSEEDFKEAVLIWGMLPQVGAPEIYCGPVWGLATPAWVAEKILNEGLPWKLNIQAHNFIWNRNKRGI